MTVSKKKLSKVKKTFLLMLCKYLKLNWNMQEIADKLKTSKQLVRYWIKRLEALGYVLRDYRSSQVFYHVYLNELKNYFFSEEVKEKELGYSLHFIKLRYPFFRAPTRRFDRVVLSEGDGVKVDVNNKSIIVWIPRFVVDRFSENHKSVIDNFAYAGILSYQVAFKYAMRVGGEIRVEDVEFIPPIHIAKGVFADFSKGWLEIEKLVRFKNNYERGDCDQEKIDRYIS